MFNAVARRQDAADLRGVRLGVVDGCDGDGSKRAVAGDVCVELNDLAEARSGNDHNVGIYQRVFGDQAEAACQREHRGNLRLLLGGRPYEQPYKADPAGYTQAFVERAIGRYNTEGRQATLDYYNSSASVDGSWYVFIAEVDGVMLAHGVTRDLVGRVFADIRSGDGFPSGQQALAVATEDGAWANYPWVNPVTGDVSTKHSWVVRHDGLLFGSGWYESGPSKTEPARYAQALVQRAVDRYDALGHEVVVNYYNTPQSADGPWYVFILNEEDVVIAHAPHPERLGDTANDRVDLTGFNYGAAFGSVAEGESRWVSYWYLNPATRMAEQKHTWVVQHDGLLFASGWYEVPDKTNPAGYAQALVSKALIRYEAEGRDVTVSYYNTPQSADGSWYVFILDEEDVVIAHATRPERLGATLNDRVDLTGYNYGAAFVSVTEGESQWVSYWYLNPTTRMEEQKHTWVVRHDGLPFGSGWYEVPDKTNPAG